MAGCPHISRNYQKVGCYDPDSLFFQSESAGPGTPVLQIP